MRKCISYKPMIHPGRRGSSRRSRTWRQRLGGDEDREGNCHYRMQGEATHLEGGCSTRPTNILPVPREHEPFAMQPWNTCPSPPHLFFVVTKSNIPQGRAALSLLSAGCHAVPCQLL